MKMNYYRMTRFCSRAWSHVALLWNNPLTLHTLLSNLKQLAVS